MPVLNEPYRIYYVAKNETAGLTDVQMHVRRPDDVVEGAFVFSEILDSELSGTYEYVYTFTQQGSYLVVVDSATQPKRIEKSYDVKQGSPFCLF